MASAVMVLALIGAPLGGFLTDRWRKTRENARLLFPALSTLLTSIVLFSALVLLKGTVQYIAFLIFGVLIMSFISGAASVTQDVIHPGTQSFIVRDSSCCSEPSRCLNCSCGNG